MARTPSRGTTSNSAPSLHRAPVRMPQVRARGAFERKSRQRHSRLLAELAQGQPEVDVQGQVVGRDLVEHRRHRHAVAVLEKIQTSDSYSADGPDRIPHGHPAAARRLVHDERRAIGVEQQILVAEQREIRRGVMRVLDQHGRALEIRRARRQDRRLATGAAAATARRRRPSWSRAAGRAGSAAPAPRTRIPTTVPCCTGTCRYANSTSHTAAPSTNSTATTQETEKRCSISEARRRKRARAETSSTATAPRHDGLLVVESLEQRQQDAGAQQPHRQIPRRIEPAVQAVVRAPAGRRRPHCRADATARESAAARSGAATPGDRRAPGVEPENSSTAPAPNTAIALACGVTALSQVRAKLRRGAPSARDAPRARARRAAPSATRERDEVINDAIGEQRAEQLIGRHRPEQQQQHRFEHAHAARHVADDAGGDGDDEHGRQMPQIRCAACGGSSTYSTPAAHSRSPQATAICAKAMRGLGTGMHDLAPAQRLVPVAREQQIGDDPAEQQRSRPTTMSERCKCSTEPDRRASRQQRQPEQRRGPQREGQRAECDHGRDLFGARAQTRIRPEADGAAAQGIQRRRCARSHSP